MAFSFNIPLEFKDEEKWFKFFSKKNLIVLVCCEGVVGLGFKLLQSVGLHIEIPYLVVGELITAIITALTMIPQPETMYLTGGGQTLADILLKKIYRKTHKILYVKGYGKSK